MIAVIDYGAGNLFSVKNALDAIGAPCEFTRDAERIAAADGVILPGVGAFPEAMRMLRATGLEGTICAQAARKPLLGICLGMQMLFDCSEEFGQTAGLGLIKGRARLIRSGGLKIPHMGWNDLQILSPCAMTQGMQGGEYVYFVHSYCVETPRENLSCVTHYGEEITALVHRGFVYGAQFHPEKSGRAGIGMLKNFAALCGRKGA